MKAESLSLLAVSKDSKANRGETTKENSVQQRAFKVVREDMSKLYKKKGRDRKCLVIYKLTNKNFIMLYYIYTE